MSATPSTKNPKTKTTTTAASNSRRTRAQRRRPAVPWIEDGIDYGPALVAVEDLMEWAFGLAERATTDDPDARRRVKSARRLIAASIAGKRVRWSRRTEDDVLFTTLLLTRIFDADLELGLSDKLDVLMELGLPTHDVPNPPRSPASFDMRTMQAAPATDLAALAAALQRSAAVVPPVAVAPIAPVVPLRRPQRAPRGAVSVVPVTCGACPLGLRVAA